MVANASTSSYVSMGSDVTSFNLTENFTDAVDIASENSTLEGIATWMWRVISPILFVGGVGGNILVVLTFSKLHVSESSTLVHLMVLAVTDCVVLATGLSRLWTINTFGFDIRTISSFGCKLYLFVIYVSMDFSSWILVSVTFERLISVYWPLHVRQWCTVPRGIIRLAAILFFLVLLNGHFFWTNTVINNKCVSINDKVRDFEEFVFVWIDMVFVCLAPFLLMLVCDCCIIAALKQARTVQKSTIANREQMKNGGRSGQTLHVSTTTRMLLSVTCFFFVTTLPVAVYFIIDSFLRPNASGMLISRLDLAWTVTYLLQYLNYSCNFLLYTARNRRFRRQLLHLLHIRRLRRGGTWMSSTLAHDTHSDDATTRRHSQLRRSRVSVVSGGSVASGLSRAPSTVFTLADLSPGSTANWRGRRGGSIASQASSLSAGISIGPSSVLTLQELSPSKFRSRFSPRLGHDEGQGRRGDGERALGSDGEEEWTERLPNGVWRRGSAPTLSLVRFVRNALRASQAQEGDVTTERGDICDTSNEVEDEEKDNMDTQGGGKRKDKEHKREEMGGIRDMDGKLHCNGNLITDIPSKQRVNVTLPGNNTDASICVNTDGVVCGVSNCIDTKDSTNGDSCITRSQQYNGAVNNDDNNNDELNKDTNDDLAQTHSASSSEPDAELCSDRDTSKCPEISTDEPSGLERDSDSGASDTEHAVQVDESCRVDSGNAVDSDGNRGDHGREALDSYDTSDNQLVIIGVPKTRRSGVKSLKMDALVCEDNDETYL